MVESFGDTISAWARDTTAPESHADPPGRAPRSRRVATHTAPGLHWTGIRRAAGQPRTSSVVDLPHVALRACSEASFRLGGMLRIPGGGAWGGVVSRFRAHAPSPRQEAGHGPSAPSTMARKSQSFRAVQIFVLPKNTIPRRHDHVPGTRDQALYRWRTTTISSRQVHPAAPEARVVRHSAPGFSDVTRPCALKRWGIDLVDLRGGLNHVDRVRSIDRSMDHGLLRVLVRTVRRRQPERQGGSSTRTA